MANKKISDLPLKPVPAAEDIIPIVDTSSQPYQTKKITVGSLGISGGGGTGDVGATGATGATGPQGAIGATGVIGATGPKGADGSGVTIRGTAVTWPPSANPAAGDMWLLSTPIPVGAPAGSSSGDGVVWSGTSWVNVGPVRGPDGATGPQGATGVAGAVGPQGATGAVGPQGSTGPAGNPASNFVLSVNGQTGAVNLTAANVGAAPANSALYVASVIDGGVF